MICVYKIRSTDKAAILMFTIKVAFEIFNFEIFLHFGGKVWKKAVKKLMMERFP